MLTMYCKLFASLYQGTLRGCSNEILVFTNLLAHADQFGIVDKHFRAIAEETGLTIEAVKVAILNLESPDPESRSPEADGARIQRLDEHRVWGWKIVNYGKYRAIKNEEDRREQNRLAQERWRNKHKQASAIVSRVSRGKPPSAQAEAEAEAVEREIALPETPPIPRKQFDALCSMRGIPPECGEWFWNTHDARNWTDATGQPIIKVEPLLLNAFSKWRAKEHGAVNGNKQQPQHANNPFALKTIIQAKENKAAEIRRKFCSDTAIDQVWSNVEKRKEYLALKKEIKELNDRISKLA